MQVATPDVIYEAPNSTYVADFIGDINLIHGKATAQAEGGLAIHWSEGQPPLIASNGPAELAGRNVVLALRPEKLSINKERPAGDNLLSGRVMDIGYLGNISTYHVKLGDGTMVKAQVANTRRISRRDITWEDEVWLGFSATAGITLEGGA